MLGPLDAAPAVGPPLTDQQILDAVGATGYYRGRAGSQSLRQRGYDAIFAALRAEQISFDTAAAGCATVASGASIQSRGFGETVLQMAGTAGLQLATSYFGGGQDGSSGDGQDGSGQQSGNSGGVTKIVSTIFSAIFGHHKKQVARERQVLCAAVPAANESLRVIETAIQNGQIAPPQAIAFLDELFNQFQGAVSAIIKSDATHCNAACVWSYSLAAIVARKKDRYAHITVKASGSRSAAERCQAWLEAGAPVPPGAPAGWRTPCLTDDGRRPAPANQGGPIAVALAIGAAGAWWLL